MKKIFYFAFLAISAFVIAGCSKEPAFQDDSDGTHTLTFNIEKFVDTKTAVIEGESAASYVWTDGDEEYFNVFENGVKATSVSVLFSEEADGGYKKATVKATFPDKDTTSYSYTATFAKSLSNSYNPHTISEQTPALNSFDPSADVLVSSEPIVLGDGVSSDENTEFLFVLKRVVSMNKMTLKGLKPGSIVQNVELSSDKNFAALYNVAKDSYTGEGMKLTMDYSSLNATVNEDGTFPVYFVSAPVENATFSVRVKTGDELYTRDDFKSKLTLAVGTFRRFGINLEGYGSDIPNETEYKLVEDNEKIVDGADYLIVAKGKGKAASAYNASKYYGVENVTVNDKVISISTEAVQVFTLEASSTEGEFFIKDSDGKYLMYSSGNTVEQSTSGYHWTVTKDGIATVDDPERKLQYNSSSPRFACYSSSQTAIELYVNEATLNLANPELSFNMSFVEVNWDERESFTAPVLNNPNGLTVTYSSTNPAVATVDPTTGEIAFVGNGETTITAKSARTGEFKAGEASYDLAVTGQVDFRSIAELNAKATSSDVMWDGCLENAVVSFVPDTKNAIIKDATGSVLVYINTDEGHGLKQGQTFSGYFSPIIKLYNGTAEIIDLDTAAFEGEETVVEPESHTLADLVGNLAKYQNAYVKVTDLFVTSVSGRNLSVMNGDNTYVVFVPNNCPIVAGDFITVTGTVAHYGDNDQIKVWSLDDIVKTGHELATPSIFFTQPSQGGSFTVEVDGSQITSGTAVKEGKTVTLTATVADGYTFNGWTVSGATVSGNTTSETFVVGTSDITISASIKSSSITYVVDVLNQSLTGITGTSYSDWSGKESNSEAVYAGNSAGGNASIQLRSNNNNSGVITTKSGGKVTKITVTWNSNTVSGRTLNIYGSNSAYTAASDLYDSSKQGTLLGTIVYGTSTELEIDGDYAYIGFRSNSGAMYLSEVEVTWSK